MDDRRGDGLTTMPEAERATDGTSRTQPEEAPEGSLVQYLYAREQFARILSENRSDLRALTSYLAYQATQIRGGGGQVAAR